VTACPFNGSPKGDFYSNYPCEKPATHTVVRPAKVMPDGSAMRPIPCCAAKFRGEPGWAVAPLPKEDS
jgi:hypothetical protein